MTADCAVVWHNIQLYLCSYIKNVVYIIYNIFLHCWVRSQHSTTSTVGHHTTAQRHCHLQQTHVEVRFLKTDQRIPGGSLCSHENYRAAFVLKTWLIWHTPLLWADFLCYVMSIYSFIYCLFVVYTWQIANCNPSLTVQSTILLDLNLAFGTTAVLFFFFKSLSSKALNKWHNRWTSCDSFWETQACAHFNAPRVYVAAALVLSVKFISVCGTYCSVGSIVKIRMSKFWVFFTVLCWSELQTLKELLGRVKRPLYWSD